jgi:hypothetical protein
MNAQDMRDLLVKETCDVPSYTLLPTLHYYVFCTQTGGFIVESRQDVRRIVTIMILWVSGEAPIVRWTEGIVQ